MCVNVCVAVFFFGDEHQPGVAACIGSRAAVHSIDITRDHGGTGAIDQLRVDRVLARLRAVGAGHGRNIHRSAT